MAKFPPGPWDGEADRADLTHAAEEGGEMTPRGFAAVGLDHPKTSANIGGVMRAAACYGVSLVVIAGNRPGALRYVTDTTKAYRHIPHLRADSVFDCIPFDAVPVAVDLISGATPLPKYKHPERAYYIFGAEDRTLGAAITERCRDIVFVDTNYCMNLAAAVNVILYDRMAKS